MIAKLVERIRSIRRACATDPVLFERELGLALEASGEARDVPASKEAFDDVLDGAASGLVQVIGSEGDDATVVISLRDLAALLREPAEAITLGDAIRNLPHRISGPVPSVRGRPPARLHLGRRGSPKSDPTEATASQDDR